MLPTTLPHARQQEAGGQMGPVLLTAPRVAGSPTRRTSLGMVISYPAPNRQKVQMGFPRHTWCFKKIIIREVW